MRAAKWDAAAAILADPQIDTLTYVDVRVAERPSIGGAAPAVTESTTEHHRTRTRRAVRTGELSSMS